MANTKLTREQWLMKMANHLKLIFKKSGYQVHKNIRVSCGLPSLRAFGPRSKTLGQCWSKNVSTDNHNEIFISPTIDESTEVAATLAHELVHAVVGLDQGHRKEFRECALAIGLTGPMTATSAGLFLKSYIDEKIIEIGEYPHAKIDYKKIIKKDQTRLIKVVCNNDKCEHVDYENRAYTVRMSRTTLSYGEPRCGCCGKFMELA